MDKCIIHQAFIFLLLFNSGCAAPKTGTNLTYSLLPPKEFKKIIDDPDTVVINVNIPPLKQIKSSDRYIPHTEINDHPEKLPQNKDTPIALYCLMGIASSKAAGELTKSGYTNVYVLKGGTMAWKQEGYASE